MRDLLVRVMLLLGVANARAARLVAAELDKMAIEYRQRLAAQMYDIATTGSAFTEISPRGIRRVAPRDVIPGPIAPLPRGDDIRLMIWIGYWLGAVISVWMMLWR